MALGDESIVKHEHRAQYGYPILRGWNFRDEACSRATVLALVPALARERDTQNFATEACSRAAVPALMKSEYQITLKLTYKIDTREHYSMFYHTPDSRVIRFLCEVQCYLIFRFHL